MNSKEPDVRPYLVVMNITWDMLVARAWSGRKIPPTNVTVFMFMTSKRELTRNEEADEGMIFNSFIYQNGYNFQVFCLLSRHERGDAHPWSCPAGRRSSRPGTPAAGRRDVSEL